MMQKIFIKILKKVSELILRKYQPQIVGITGSVGKTSAKEAILAVLSSNFKVRGTIKNYNNEFGLPLSIIGRETGGHSVLAWLRIFAFAVKILILRDKNYPEILVLEMGADRPGDIEYLLTMAPVNVGVLTAVAEAHLDGFKTLEGVLKEKENILLHLPEDGRAIFNFDDPLVRTIESDIKDNYYTYGFNEGAAIRAQEMYFAGLDEEACSTQNDWDCRLWGTGFKVASNGSNVPAFLPRSFGRQHVYAALAAIGVGLHYKMNMIEISEGLRRYRPARGRMNVLAGLKSTLIIDDTYNSSPSAVKAALENVSKIAVRTGARKFIVLGDMLELGKDSQALHEEIGTLVAQSGADFLFGVGPMSDYLINAAKSAGMSKTHVYHFEDVEVAGNFLQDLIEPNDLIFVKGSQGMRMEKIIKIIMADPLLAKDLLVRQGSEWQ